MIFKVCGHFSQRFFNFNGISSVQSKEIIRSCRKINFASGVDGTKSPNVSESKDMKLSKPHFNDENNFTAFTLIVLLSGFHNIPKAFSNGILSKSRLTDWQFADKSFWG